MPRLVLVADDSPTHQRRASGILTGEGLEVVTVSNGVAAIKKLPSIKPALVLADVAMPGRDGYEVCEFVKSSPELANVPVLLIYSDLEPCDEARARRAGADGRIQKPFGQDELVAVVNRYIAQAEAAAALPKLASPPPSPPATQVEPVDLPPEDSARIEIPDFGTLGESAPFTEMGIGDAPHTAAEQPPPAWPMHTEAPEEAREQAASLAPEVAPAPLPAPTEDGSTGPEPLLAEESTEAPRTVEEETPERTMLFRMPVQIAEPVLADDLAPAPAVGEVPLAPPPPASTTEPELGPAMTVAQESVTEEAPASPQLSPERETTVPEEVSLPASLPAETAEPAVTEPPAVMPEPAPEVAGAPVPTFDTELVYWIVHNVVVRMAPPALSTAAVEDLIRQISDEITNELMQPPPETQA